MVSSKLIFWSSSQNFVPWLTFEVFHQFGNDEITFTVLKSLHICFSSSSRILNQGENSLSTFSLYLVHVGIFYCEIRLNWKDICVCFILTDFKQDKICVYISPDHVENPVIKLVGLISNHFFVLRRDRLPKWYVKIWSSTNPFKPTHRISQLNNSIALNFISSKLKLQ